MSFAQARIEALFDLAQECQVVEIARGQKLWAAGRESLYALVIESGVVHCTTANETQRFDIGPRSFVGGLDALASIPRWYTAVARSPVRALRVEIQSLLDVVEDNVGMGVEMLRSFAQAMVELEDRAGPEEPDS